jgi:hypothetical protein
MKRWVKYGLWFSGIYLGLVLFFILLLPFFGVLSVMIIEAPISPIGWVSQIINNNSFRIWHGSWNSFKFVALNAISWMAIGSIIGVIVGKIKK